MRTINAGIALQGDGKAVSIPRQVFEDFALNNLSGGALRTYGILSLWKTRDACDSWPSQSDLARAMKTTRRSVSRYLAELGEYGHLRRIHNVPKSQVEYLLVAEDASNHREVCNI